MENKNNTTATNIAAVIGPLDATGALTELAEAKGGHLTAAEAREALEGLYAADPAAAAAIRETFLAWPSERQSAAIDILAGGDGSARRTWTRLLLGIVERPDGAIALA